MGAAIGSVLDVIKDMQKGTDEDPNPKYFFQRNANNPTDSLIHGMGLPCRRTGMSRSPFRPSGLCLFHFDVFFFFFD